jgi:hypothetical protein
MIIILLRVSPQRGLFYFCPEFRPVPLEQTFIGEPQLLEPVDAAALRTAFCTESSVCRDSTGVPLCLAWMCTLPGCRSLWRALLE